MASPSTYLTPQAVAERLNIPTRLLGRWRAAGRGPRCVSLSERTFRYRLDEVERWEAARLRGEEAA